MNAHSPIAACSLARSSISDLENPLARIVDLARSASTVIEHDMGNVHPAGQLETLLQLIVEEAEKAEEVRARGFAGG